METYKIIGGDKREYGPVPLDELRAWIRDGRVGRETLVFRGDSGTWNAASEYSELAADFEALYGPPKREPEFVRAGFWPRFAAFVIDRIVVAVAVQLVWLAVGPLLAVEQPGEVPKFVTLTELLQFLEAHRGFYLATWLIGFFGEMFYHVMMNGRFGATLGKMALGLEILDIGGARIGYRQAFARWLGTLASRLICWIGYLMVAFRSDKRALHDLIAGTQVVYKNR